MADLQSAPAIAAWHQDRARLYQCAHDLLRGPGDEQLAALRAVVAVAPADAALVAVQAELSAALAGLDADGLRPEHEAVRALWSGESGCARRLTELWALVEVGRGIAAALAFGDLSGAAHRAVRLEALVGGHAGQCLAELAAALGRCGLPRHAAIGRALRGLLAVDLALLAPRSHPVGTWPSRRVTQE